MAIFGVEKALVVKYSERVSVTLGIEHVMRMCSIVLSSVVCPPLSYFSTLSDKRHDFREKITGHKMCHLIYSTNFV